MQQYGWGGFMLEAYHGNRAQGIRNMRNPLIDKEIGWRDHHDPTI